MSVEPTDDQKMIIAVYSHFEKYGSVKDRKLATRKKNEYCQKFKLELPKDPGMLDNLAKKVTDTVLNKVQENEPEFMQTIRDKLGDTMYNDLINKVKGAGETYLKTKGLKTIFNMISPIPFPF